MGGGCRAGHPADVGGGHGLRVSAPGDRGFATPRRAPRVRLCRCARGTDRGVHTPLPRALRLAGRARMAPVAAGRRAGAEPGLPRADGAGRYDRHVHAGVPAFPGRAGRVRPPANDASAAASWRTGNDRPGRSRVHGRVRYKASPALLAAQSHGHGLQPRGVAGSRRLLPRARYSRLLRRDLRRLDPGRFCARPFPCRGAGHGRALRHAPLAGQDVQPDGVEHRRGRHSRSGPAAQVRRRGAPPRTASERAGLHGRAGGVSRWRALAARVAAGSSAERQDRGNVPLGTPQPAFHPAGGNLSGVDRRA